MYNKIKELTFQKSGVDPYIQQFKYYYIVHKIIADNTFHKGNYVGCKLNIDTLTALFGCRDSQSSAMVNDLVKWGIIVETEKFKFKRSSTRYALTDTYLHDRYTIMDAHVSDAGFIKKLINSDQNEINKTLKQLKYNIQLLTLNQAGLDYLNFKYSYISSCISPSSLTLKKALDQKTAFNVSKTKILDQREPQFLLGGYEVDQIDLPLIQILLGDFNSTRPDEMSRVYNNLTNLKREFRQFIEFNGKPLIMTDVNSSQVLISVAAIKKQYSISSGKGLLGLPDDIKHYQSLAESGLFYEFLMEKAGHNGDRTKFKKQFFTDVFFSKVANWSTPIKDAFINAFPTVYKIINELKAKDYKQFAISMQKLEANIMIDTVAKKMVKAGKLVLTLHDAIVCTSEDDLQFAEQLISDAMVKYDISPKFKREGTGVHLEKISEEYNEELDTVTLIVNNATYHFANHNIILSNVSEQSEIDELREKLMGSQTGSVYFKNKIYEFAKAIDGNETLILLVA
ncbi:MAG: hypothetical protein V4687_06775 [Bacteroidota bacterium]